MPKLPSPANVPSISPARDPGLRVPSKAFESTIGIAAQELQPLVEGVADRFVAADARIKKREAAIDRIRLRNEFREERRELLEATRATGDFSVPGVKENYGKVGRDKIEELAGQLSGEENQLRFREVVEDDFFEYADKAAGLSVDLSDARVKGLAGEIINSLSARALQGEDPSTLISEGMEHIMPGTELADAMREGGEITFAQDMQEGVVSSSIERLFGAGDIRGVEDVLGDPAVQRMLGTNTQIGFFKRIETIRRERGKPIILSPGQKAFTGTGEEIASGGKKTEKLVEIFDIDSPTKTRFVTASDALGKPGGKRPPIISITNESETALAKELGKRDAQRVAELEDNAQTAQRTIVEVQRMQAATESGRFTTGVFSDVRVFLSRLANFMGATDETLVLLGDAATADTLDAATNRLAVEEAQKLGRITNLSLQFIRDSLPNLIRTPEGNIILMEVMLRTSDREIKLASLAEEFLQREGTLRPKEGRSYFQAVRDLEEEDPVITEELRRKIIEGSKRKTKTFKDIFADTVTKVISSQEKPAVSAPPAISTPEEFEQLDSGASFIWTPTGESGQKD